MTPSLLDRHLLLRCTSASLAIAAMATVLVVGLDLLLNLADLLDGSLEEDESRFGLVLWLALLKLPEVVGPLLPVAVAGGILITLSPMLRRGELVALTAAGISLRRCSRALLAVALAFGLIDALISDQLDPRLEGERSAVEDRLTGGKRHGRSWVIEDTGTAWYAQRLDLRRSGAPRLHEVVAAPTDGRLVAAEQLRGGDDRWRFHGAVRVVQPQGPAAGLEQGAGDGLPLDGDLAIPFRPQDLSDALASRHARTTPDLLRRGKRLDIAMVVRRWMRIVVPVLTAMCLLPVFLRFDRRDHMITAAIGSLAVAAVPSLVLAAGGAWIDTSEVPVLPGSLAVLAAASILPVTLFLRWRE